VLELASTGPPYDRDRLGAGTFPEGVPSTIPGGSLPVDHWVELPAGLAAPGRLRITVDAADGWAEVSLAREAEGGSPPEPFLVALALPPLGLAARPALVGSSGPSRGGILVLDWIWQPCGATRLRAMTPPAGPAVAATEVRIAGDGLAAAEGWKAFLDSSPLLEVAAAGHSELRALVPPGDPGTADLLVLGASHLARLRRAYTRGPMILGLDPATGDAAGGGRVRIYLAGLPGGDLPEIIFGDAKALEVVRPLEGVLVVTAPPGPPGKTVSVRLTHPVGDAAGGGYTYLRTLKVPEGFPSLATAAAAAINGSRIELGPGEHPGSSWRP